MGCPDEEEPNSRDCVALVSQGGREIGALYRDLECGSTFQDFAVGVICQRGGLETSTTTTTPTTTSPATTTTDYSHHVELRGGSVGLTEAWGSSDADVVCRQLGYARGDAYQNSHWGSVPSHFAMNDVECRGDERQSQKNPVSASAMLTGKFLQIRKVIATSLLLVEEFPDILENVRILYKISR